MAITGSPRSSGAAVPERHRRQSLTLRPEHGQAHLVVLATTSARVRRPLSGATSTVLAPITT